MFKILLCFLFISCAKTSYLIEQGIGQLALEWNGRSNKKVLADPKVSQADKDKIKTILKAKAFFFKYFDLDETGIYNETTFLESKAVTHLVIASPKNKIEAVKVNFPIMGSFPYLGFFKKSSAQAYAEKMQREGFHTYMREVYAYSTLDQWVFEDNILSSFFVLPEERLVELIFHELVHTVIFVKDDVQFNENYAQFVAQKLVEIYFNYDEIKRRKIKRQKRAGQQLNNLIVSYAKQLDELYQKSSDHGGTLNNFLRNSFKTGIRQKCEQLELKKCWPLKGKWNNARFAALKTYEAKHDKIAQVFAATKLDLKDFFRLILRKYDKFNGRGKFIDKVKPENMMI